MKVKLVLLAITALCAVAFDASLTTEIRVGGTSLLRNNLNRANAKLAKLTHSAPWTSRAEASTALFFRGGAIGASADTATALESLDLRRAGLRLEGLGTYGIISALLMNAAITLYFNTNRQQLPDSTPRERAAQTTFCVTSIISILASFSTTLVFSLLGLYSKTLLGLGRDASYLEFMEGTKLIRRFTFKSFRLSMLLFQLSCCLTMFLTNQGRNRYVATILSVALVALSCWQYGSIIWLASRLLFSD